MRSRCVLAEAAWRRYWILAMDEPGWLLHRVWRAWLRVRHRWGGARIVEGRCRGKALRAAHLGVAWRYSIGVDELVEVQVLDIAVRHRWITRSACLSPNPRAQAPGRHNRRARRTQDAAISLADQEYRCRSSRIADLLIRRDSAQFAVYRGNVHVSTLSSSTGAVPYHDGRDERARPRLYAARTPSPRCTGCGCP